MKNIAFILSLIFTSNLLYADNYQALLKQGEKYLNAHKVDKAIESLEKVCESKQAKKSYKAKSCELLMTIYSGYFEYTGLKQYSEIKDDEKKIKYATMGCDFGSATSCSNLGYWYKKGDGVEVDLDKATSYYIKACELQPKLHCNSLGVFYEFELKDIESALRVYKKVCQQNKMCANYERLSDNLK
ncbi:tetratricopeptide repeat protein [Helicobacter sp. 23-1045]